jgi:hypothetical protein
MKSKDQQLLEEAYQKVLKEQAMKVLLMASATKAFLHIDTQCLSLISN